VTGSKRLERGRSCGPGLVAPPERWRAFPEIHLIQPLIFLHLVADLLADHGLVPPNRDTTRPKALPSIILFPLSVHPGKMDGTLALDKTASVGATALPFS
jgi:hypothetical protein